MPYILIVQIYESCIGIYASKSLYVKINEFSQRNPELTFALNVRCDWLLCLNMCCDVYTPRYTNHAYIGINPD